MFAVELSRGRGKKKTSVVIGMYENRADAVEFLKTMPMEILTKGRLYTTIGIVDVEVE